MSSNELRHMVFGAEFRTESIGERILSTRIVPYNEVSYDVPYDGGEEFLPGSFAKSLREAFRSRPLKLFRSHEHGRAIGVSTSLDERDHGLFGEFRVANGAVGDEVLDEAGQGLLDAMSVGFRALVTRRGSKSQRQIVEAALLEASICPLGAYSGGQVLAMRTPSTPGMPVLVPAPPPPMLDLARPIYRTG
jgi:HK97 family phage prohead protease